MSLLTAKELIARTNLKAAQVLSEFDAANKTISNALNLASQTYIAQIPASEHAYFTGISEKYLGTDYVYKLFNQKTSDFCDIPEGIPCEGITERFNAWVKYAVLLNNVDVSIFVDVIDALDRKALICKIQNDGLKGTEAALFYNENDEDGTLHIDINKCYVSNHNQADFFKGCSRPCNKINLPAFNVRLNSETDLSIGLIQKSHKAWVRGKNRPFCLDTALDPFTYKHDDFRFKLLLLTPTLFEHCATGGRIAKNQTGTITALLENAYKIDDCTMTPGNANHRLRDTKYISNLQPGYHQQFLEGLFALNSQITSKVLSFTNKIAVICMDRFRKIDYESNPMEAMMFLNAAEDVFLDKFDGTLFGLQLKKYKNERTELRESQKLAETLDECVRQLNVTPMNDNVNNDDRALLQDNSL
ncbi:hypothetical protein [Shewanella aestuarii]|uniref:Uncharacterized protein n=1 Tax=Shewanella aestuarii TaxID=1028752 RepID=A0A6G9QPZ0_9GAMM|nr:hypothetical protein [Shewanella aestuarii]QIR16626.1 hypothetical protein HBH39_19310 [Shewanella aestuarii]